MTPALALSYVAAFAAGMAWGIYCDRRARPDQSAEIEMYKANDALNERHVAALLSFIRFMDRMNRPESHRR